MPLFCICNGLVMSKGWLCVSTMAKGEAEGILAFLVLTNQHHVALNGVHCDMGHQGQQRTLALTGKILVAQDGRRRSSSGTRWPAVLCL